MDISTTNDNQDHHQHLQQQQQRWRIGQVVDVQPRTWAGINRQGGTGKITAIHSNGNLDIKYILSGFDKDLPPHLVAPHEELERTTRRQRSAAALQVVPLEDNSSNGTGPVSIDKARVKKNKLPSHQQPRTRVKSIKRAKPVVAAAASVRSTPSACSSTASSIVSYVPKEIAVPVARTSSNDPAQDKNPPLFSPLTVAGGVASASRKKKTLTLASSSSSAGGPPSVIEECYMSDDNEPSTLERTMESPDDGTSAMMLDSHDDDSPNVDASGEAKCTKNKLLGVFKDDRKQAMQFIDSVIESNQDFNRFSSQLNEALLQNDGALDLADLTNYIADDGGGKAYSDDQIHQYLQHLCTQNRIMRSDDVIYGV